MDKHTWGLEWSDGLSVGLPEIDRKHRQFIKLINDLDRAIVDRMELDDFRGSLQRLLDYTVQEFAGEDEWLKQVNYPEASLHSREHQTLLREFNDAIGRLDGASPMYPWIEAGIKIKERLIRHLLEDDMKFRDYNGTRPN